MNKKVTHILFMIGILFLFYGLPRIVHLSYKFALTLLIGKYLFLIGLAVYLIKYCIQKHILYRRERIEVELPQKCLWLSAVVLSICVILSNGLMLISLIKPFNLYTTDTKANIKENVLYVTTNSDCIYCQVSYENMLRAVQVYSDIKGADVRVVQLNENTPLSKALNKRVDHYGSILRIDKSKMQYETAYTLANQEGKPIKNTASNIYQMLEKVRK